MSDFIDDLRIELARALDDLTLTKAQRDVTEAERDRYGADYERAKVDHVRHLRSLLAWVNERWSAEIDHRPRSNIYRKTLEATWGQVKQKLSDEIETTEREMASR